MEGPTPRKVPAYPGEMTDENIRRIFEDANDFVFRTIKRDRWDLYVYAIDGLVSGGDISQYILKPITELLTGETMEKLYDRALHGGRCCL